MTENKIFAQRVTIPEFEIIQSPIIRISEVKRRRFNMIDRGAFLGQPIFDIDEATVIISSEEDSNEDVSG